MMEMSAPSGEKPVPAAAATSRRPARSVLDVLNALTCGAAGARTPSALRRGAAGCGGRAPALVALRALARAARAGGRSPGQRRVPAPWTLHSTDKLAAV